MTDVNTKLKVGRALPIAQPEDQEVEQRGDKYGNTWTYGVTTSTHPYADDGSSFCMTNPTPGTALLYSIQTTFVDTTPFLYIFNQETAANGAAPDVCIEQIKIIVTVAPATSTAAFYAIVLDNAPRTFTTDNTATLTPVLPNFGVSPRSAFPLIKVQNSLTNSVITASSPSKRIIARGSLGGLPVAGDTLRIILGRVDGGAFSGSATAGAKSDNSPGFEIAPLTSAVVHLWFPGNAATGLSYEFEMSGWIR